MAAHVVDAAGVLSLGFELSFSGGQTLTHPLRIEQAAVDLSLLHEMLDETDQRAGSECCGGGMVLHSPSALRWEAGGCFYG